MIPNTSTQSQDLFKDCLGFARQLSQSPGVYCKLEVKLGENSFKFETGNPGKFPGKRKSPSDYRRDQRRKNPPGKEMPTPGNHGVFSSAPGDHTRAQKEVISRAPPSSPPCSRTVPWSKHLFSPSDIPQLDGAESFSSVKELYIQASTPSEYSQFTPLAPIHQLHPTLPPTPRQPVSNKPAPSPPLYQPPIKQLQSTQILAPITSISPLPEEDEPEQEQPEPETDQHDPEQKQQEPEPDQHEPEPEKQSEVLSNGVPRDLYHADGTPNYGKAALYIESLRLNHPSYVQAAKYI